MDRRIMRIEKSGKYITKCIIGSLEKLFSKIDMISYEVLNLILNMRIIYTKYLD